MSSPNKTDEWSLTTVWNQTVNLMVQLCPALFGCRRVTLGKVKTRKELENLCALLEKLGAVKVAEAHGSTGESNNFYFRVQNKPIALSVEAHQPVTIIAPEPLIEYIQNEMKVILE